MPGMTEEMMSSGGITADCCKLYLEGCTWMMDTGMCQEKGCSSNLPAGEIYLDGIIKKPVLFLDGEKFILSHDNI